VGTVTLSDTTAAVFVSSPRGASSVGAGSPTLADSMFSAPVTFTASASETVVLPVAQPDALYAVMASPSAPWSISGKTAGGFTIDLVFHMSQSA